MIQSAFLRGVEAVPLRITCTIQPTPYTSFDLHGLSEPAMRDARIRVRSALKLSGFELRSGSVTVTLDPPVTSYDAPYDLPIALAILQAQGLLTASQGFDPDTLMVIGSLSLNGKVQPVRGVAAFGHLAQQQGLAGLLCPFEQATEAELTPIPVLAAPDLETVVEGLLGQGPFPPFGPPKTHEYRAMCWSDVRGCAKAKRALKIAAAGGHSILLAGKQGTGKTLLARRLPTILAPLSTSAKLEATKCHSAAGFLTSYSGALHNPPFQAPHFTASTLSLTGGGRLNAVGVLSLAHRGVLYLDEALEFPYLSTVLDVAKKGYYPTYQNQTEIRLPTQALVVASTPPEGALHPLMRQFDLLVHLGQDTEECPETSKTVQQQVMAAQERQILRQGSLNSQAWALPALDPGVLAILPEGNLTLQRVAWTIADLAGSATVLEAHAREALQYRNDGP